MPERILAQINPAALAWAREALAMPPEIAARKIGVSENRLQSFESGEALPTTNQLRNVARTYRRSTAFFYLDTLPDPPQRISDFRLLPDADDSDLPELLDAVEAARERRKVALELSDLLGQEPPAFGVDASIDDAPEQIATRIRDRLGVSFQMQRGWRERYTVLREWTAAVEKAGVLVTQFSGVDVRTARGFAITEYPYPVVALNGGDFPRPKVFTLFHELAHISIGSSGLCDLHDETERLIVEPFCNRVAAEALVPGDRLLTEPLVDQHDGLEWEDWRLNELANTYGVSAEVVLRRILTLGRTTEAFYQNKRDEYIQAAEEAATGRGGFLAYFRRVLRNNGSAFSRLVLEAYHSDVVTPTEASRFLGGIKLRHVTAIEEALRDRRT